MHKIAIVGEAWGAEEERARTAFIGRMSWQLNPMLEEAGINPAEVYKTNVFNLRYDGKIEIFCGPKAEGIPGYGPLSKQGKYVRQEFAPELDRLAEEICDLNPNLIIPMGNTPLWAFTGHTGISKFRGTTSLSTHTATGFKILPTYHPAAIIHQWELRPITVIDLMKAAREAEFPEVRRPQREIWIEPTLEDICEFDQHYVQNCKELTVDIETAGHFITCIGFATGRGHAIVIPFVDRRRKGRSYWPTHEDERKAWDYIRRTLAGPIRKVFQNGLYDIAFLWRAYGIKTMNASEDTMLLHHALQPEALKGLGFLGSIYTDEGAWKHMRARHETIKKDN